MNAIGLSRPRFFVQITLYNWTVTGTQTISVSVQNPGSTVTNIHNIDVVAPPENVQALTSVSVDGPSAGAAGTAYAFSASIQPTDATQPVNYAWFPEPVSGQGTATAQIRWSTIGSKRVQVVASNSGSIVTGTHMLQIGEPPQDVVILEKVTIAGDGSAAIGESSVFSATIQPANATQPVAYI